VYSMIEGERVHHYGTVSTGGRDGLVKGEAWENCNIPTKGETQLGLLLKSVCFLFEAD